MKKVMNVLFGLVIVVSLAVASSCVVEAGIISIPLTNPSFDLPGTGKITTGFNTVPGWSNGSTDSYEDSGVEQATGDGSNWSAFLHSTDPDGGSLLQMTDHLVAADDIYTLTFSCKEPGRPSSLRATFYYMDGATLMTIGTTVLTIANETWGQYTYSCQATAAAVGKNVGIYFSNVSYLVPVLETNTYLSLDNVVLTYVVPEPASLALLALSGLALFRRRR